MTALSQLWEALLTVATPPVGYLLTHQGLAALGLGLSVGLLVLTTVRTWPEWFFLPTDDSPRWLRVTAEDSATYAGAFRPAAAAHREDRTR